MGDELVLGANAAHDASACLLVGGRLMVAIGEERLSRVKHHEGFPYRAIEYCLRAGGIGRLDSVDCLVINQYAKSDYDVELANHGFSGRLIVNPSHHLLHAYYAWVASGYRDASVMILDGSGYSFGEYERRGSPGLGAAPHFSEMEEAESLYSIVDGAIEVTSKRWALWESSDPYYRFASLGHMYSMASQYIFGHWKHAGKTMGLAAFGDSSALSEPIVDISGEEMVIDTLWVTRLPPRSSLPPGDDPVCRNVAAKVQAELERAILHLADVLHRRTGHTNLAISGGVGLNSVTNGRILRESKFTSLFVTPAAGDSGVAIGAALYGHHELTDTVPRWTYTDDYHGRAYTASEVESSLKRRNGLVRWEDVTTNAAELAAGDVAAGRVVGWFELGSEFGPRSLGHRSILCDPRDPGMRAYLNDQVKFREAFRPYAASVLAERADEYFNIAADDPFMLIVAPVRPERAGEVPAVTHVDGTCRIQSVRRGHAGQFRALIESFYRRTGVPLVLNTSFNIRGEPIVETPDEALDCFLASNLDVLFLEGRRVGKVRAAKHPCPGELVPVLSPGLTLELTVTTRDGMAQRATHVVRTRTGHRDRVTDTQFALLAAVDGERSVDEIGDLAGTAASDARTAFVDLQARGFAAFRFPGVR